MTTILPLKVINLWSGPGGGKSTTAAGLFNIMKHMRLDVELVTEVAKDRVYAKDFQTLGNQFLTTAEQDERLRRLVGKAEWAITDAPFPIARAYMSPEYADWLPRAITPRYHQYDNYSVLLYRSKGYSMLGRTQTLEQAKALDITISHLCEEYSWGREPLRTPGDPDAPRRIIEWLSSRNALPTC